MTMHFRLFVMLTLSAALMGCGNGFHEPPVDQTHPANPAAPTTPLPPASAVLSSGTTLPVDLKPNPAISDDPSLATQPVAAYACPMHPEVVSNQPAKCPKCGMKLIANSETGREP